LPRCETFNESDWLSDTTLMCSGDKKTPAKKTRDVLIP
jgi:hypothetical protein